MKTYSSPVIASKQIKIMIADLNKTEHAKAVVTLLNRYAMHPMGGGEPLPDFTLKNLATALAKRPDCYVILAYDENLAVGLCNCIEGFSSFACKPLLNIHDVYVEETHRGQGIANRMMQRAEQLARDNGCCKVTLEVLTRNDAAKTSYSASGYAPYQLDEQYGHAEFWQKSLHKNN